ncbi:MAG: arginine deiminase family protein [Candidatus Thermoplasmatota archaeon]|nr:arginine deiminase family protein [Candidatus Thermoplasmatota archaeon]
MKAHREWDTLKEVMVHTPGTEIDYAMLAPKPFLFERSFNTEVARREHQNLVSTLRSLGVKVNVLKDLVVSSADNDMDFRKRLEAEILSRVKFYGNMDRVEESKDYLSRNIGNLDSTNLFSTLTLDPSIDLKEDVENNLAYPRIYSNVPLANLYFMRDQQAVSDKGMMIGNMKRSQRKGETDVTEFVFRNLFKGSRVEKVPEGAILEGGDFMPAGNFSLIGIGERSNLEGAISFIKSGLIESEEIGVVSNPIYDFMEKEGLRDPMVNMHLDTYFNIAGDGISVGSADLMRRASLDLYSCEGELIEKGLTLYDYMKRKGFSNIDLRVSEQMSYSSNFLTVKDRVIVNVNVGDVLDRLLREEVFSGATLDAIRKDLNSKGRENLFPNSTAVKEFGVDNIEIKLSELTGGYGGAHCMTATLER